MNSESDDTISRRKFLMKMSLAAGSVAGLAVSIPVISALLAPLLKKKNEVWRKVGVLKDFSIHSTNLVKFSNADPEAYAGVSGNSAAWLRRNSENEFIAFTANCTHLGCPVRWEEGAQLFMCPCHGGVYYKDGSVAVGPPLKPLTQYEVRVVNEEVQIKTAPMPFSNINATPKQ